MCSHLVVEDDMGVTRYFGAASSAYLAVSTPFFEIRFANIGIAQLTLKALRCGDAGLYAWPAVPSTNDVG
jgi:hypothetical protein